MGSFHGLLVLVLWATGMVCSAGLQHNYGDALSKCILFFEGQRSGKLPPSQRLTWRKDSALTDGHDVGADLVGGYYDAGDNVKFGFPMAFTTTVLAWSIIEFGPMMGSEAVHANEALRWATDYLLKASAVHNKLYVQVGDPNSDHNCWVRPEDMDTLRTTYLINSTNPGSEVAAETAAALAAASIVFKASDPDYSQKLLSRSIKVFHFANKYRGSYDSSVGSGACPFYCDINGYQDELVWGAAWIHKASGSVPHGKYVSTHIHNLDYSFWLFGWDAKQAGAFVLLYKDIIQNHSWIANYSHQMAEKFACTLLPESPTKVVEYSPGGLMIKTTGGGLQSPVSVSFLLLIFARYLDNAKETISCSNNIPIPPSRLIQVAKSQVDYVLGDNPLGMSYMVGYGLKFPERIHHRASSLPSISNHPSLIPCKGGTPYYISQTPNPNLLIGALVAGPNVSDAFADNRELAIQSEPATYENAPMVGLLAYFSAFS